jgi:hypothetical protein
MLVMPFISGEVTCNLVFYISEPKDPKKYAIISSHISLFITTDNPRQSVKKTHTDTIHTNFLMYKA